MSRTHPRFAARVAIVVIVTGVLAGGARAAVLPPITLPQIPGSQTERFRISVEGTSTAITDEHLSGTTGCTAVLNSHMTELTTYRRGRGVVMEFTRLGTGPRAPIILRRAGRVADTSLALVVTTRRTSSGSATRTSPPGVPPEVCASVDEDLASGSECGTPQLDRARASMAYARRSVEVVLIGLSAVVEIDCTKSSVRGGFPDLRFGWPTPAKAPRIPLTGAEIFGTRRVIVKTVDTGRKHATESGMFSGGLAGTRAHSGRNWMTLRLIRIP